MIVDASHVEECWLESSLWIKDNSIANSFRTEKNSRYFETIFLNATLIENVVFDSKLIEGG